MACGSLLLTNDLTDNGQAELFQDGVHLATYREPEDLLDKLAFYLDREKVRARIAAAGRAEAIEKHTYRHRMERVLREVEAALGRVTVGGHSVNGRAHSQHDAFYFGHARPEVVELVPNSGRKILDIGCGTGRLGEALKARQPAEVIGIELDEAAAAVARTRLDAVITSDAEQAVPDFPPASFDAIVCADILEHLRDPGGLLPTRAGLGKPVVLSLPVSYNELLARAKSAVLVLPDIDATFQPRR